MARSRPHTLLVEALRGILAVGVLLTLSLALYTVLERLGA